MLNANNEMTTLTITAFAKRRCIAFSFRRGSDDRRGRFSGDDAKHVQGAGFKKGAPP